jgi:hypothetical protein
MGTRFCSGTRYTWGMMMPTDTERLDWCIKYEVYIEGPVQTGGYWINADGQGWENDMRHFDVCDPREALDKAMALKTGDTDA